MDSHPRPRSLTVGSAAGGGLSGSEPEYEFVRRIRIDGHAVVYRSWPRPSHHRMVGCGVGHDDAEFAETGRSMAAYYENGEAYGGRWWEDDSRSSAGFRYYGRKTPDRFQTSWTAAS